MKGRFARQRMLNKKPKYRQSTMKVEEEHRALEFKKGARNHGGQEL